MCYSCSKLLDFVCCSLVPFLPTSLDAISISLRCIVGIPCHLTQRVARAHLNSILHELQDVVVSKVCMRNSWKLLFPLSGQMFDLRRERARERARVKIRLPYNTNLINTTGYSLFHSVHEYHNSFHVVSITNYSITETGIMMSSVAMFIILSHSR